MPARLGPLLGAGLVAACSITVAPTWDRSFNLEPPLPTIPTIVCHPTEVSGILHGDPRDPRVTWLTLSDGTRREVVWPTGYRARFRDLNGTLVLEVLDEKATNIAGEADWIRRTCDSGLPDVVLLMSAARMATSN